MSLIQPLPDGPLDVVGDIHGEWEALAALLQHLGYDAQARHPQGRKLVFVGDLCDRGPDSPAVIARVAEWVAAGRAWVTIGNHEINLLANDAKDGSAWFFDERIASDDTRYAPYARATDPVTRAAIRQFFASLPVGLEREDLRVIHAAWVAPQVLFTSVASAGCTPITKLLQINASTCPSGSGVTTSLNPNLTTCVPSGWVTGRNDGITFTCVALLANPCHGGTVTITKAGCYPTAGRAVKFCPLASGTKYTCVTGTVSGAAITFPALSGLERLTGCVYVDYRIVVTCCT